MSSSRIDELKSQLLLKEAEWKQMEDNGESNDDIKDVIDKVYELKEKIAQLETPTGTLPTRPATPPWGRERESELRNEALRLRQYAFLSHADKAAADSAYADAVAEAAQRRAENAAASWAEGNDMLQERLNIEAQKSLRAAARAASAAADARAHAEKRAVLDAILAEGGGMRSKRRIGRISISNKKRKSKRKSKRKPKRKKTKRKRR